MLCKEMALVLLNYHSLDGLGYPSNAIIELYKEKSSGGKL